MKIKKNDTIKIIAGKDKGKEGKITAVDYKTGKVVVNGLNLYKKHVRPKRQGEKGQMVTVSKAFNISNAMLVCSSCKKATRAGYRIEAGIKQRICKKCKAVI